MLKWFNPQPDWILCIRIIGVHASRLLFSVSLSISSLQTCCLAYLSVCLSVRKVYCGKIAERIGMPFGIVSGVGWGVDVLDGSRDRRREGAVLGVNLGHPIVINGAFVTHSSKITLRTCYKGAQHSSIFFSLWQLLNLQPYGIREVCTPSSPSLFTWVPWTGKWITV